MRTEYEAMKIVPKVTMREMFTNPVLRQPLIIAIAVMICQQLSGINAVSRLSFILFKDCICLPLVFHLSYSSATIAMQAAGLLTYANVCHV